MLDRSELVSIWVNPFDFLRKSFDLEEQEKPNKKGYDIHFSCPNQSGVWLNIFVEPNDFRNTERLNKFDIAQLMSVWVPTEKLFMETVSDDLEEEARTFKLFTQKPKGDVWVKLLLEPKDYILVNVEETNDGLGKIHLQEYFG